ncbi:preprotein translocase subunit SecG [Candidatus Peregrinibacteria bacterium]|nr:preprotein translocase subunit SecG [Candidatus Peregrinibacteria bacterium]
MAITIIHIVQIAAAILLILTILSQNRGGGLGSVFGGEGGFYASRRGIEKVLANITIGLSILFLLSSIVYTLVG